MYRVQGSEHMAAGQVPNMMSGQGLNPHAAAALQFWLSQGALNPHAHSSYFPSLPYGDPLRHHFKSGAHCCTINIIHMLCSSCRTMLLQPHADFKAGHTPLALLLAMLPQG